MERIFIQIFRRIGVIVRVVKVKVIVITDGTIIVIRCNHLLYTWLFALLPYLFALSLLVLSYILTYMVVVSTYLLVYTLVIYS